MNLSSNNQPGTPKIDWAAVRSRMELAAASFKKGASQSAAEKQRILKERARTLAREAPSGLKTTNSVDMVIFLLAEEKYAIEASFVREVFPLKELVVLPGTPAFVLGITNVRGQLLSVIDLKKFFDLPEKGLTERDKIIIVGYGELEIGIRADAVSGVSPIAVDALQPALPTMTGLREKYLRGLTADRTIVLDMIGLLSDPQIIINDPAG